MWCSRSGASSCSWSGRHPCTWAISACSPLPPRRAPSCCPPFPPSTAVPPRSTRSSTTPWVGSSITSGSSTRWSNAGERNRPKPSSRDMNNAFRKFAHITAEWVGSSSAFFLALVVIIAWAATGPIFNFSDTWQLVINTGTTIVTFLMVFLIQNSQNRDAAAIQVKLDELIRVSKAQKSFIGLEHLTEEELEEIRRRCEEAAKLGLDTRGHKRLASFLCVSAGRQRSCDDWGLCCGGCGSGPSCSAVGFPSHAWSKR